MTLVDKYLNAIKEQLPRAQRDDVVAELADDLHSQIEDREAELGRPLDEAEQAAILRRFGNPMVVAARLRGDTRSVSFGRQLIGPELFPTYLKVLTVNVVITAVIVAVIVLVGGGTAWSSTYGGLVPIAVQFVIVTGIFIYADRHLASEPDRWDPFTMGESDPIANYGNLDTISNQLIGKATLTSVPFTTSLLDFALLAFGLAILRAIGLPDQVGAFAPGPGWAELYTPVCVLFAVGLIGPIVTLLRPTAVRFRALTRALYDGAFAVLMAISLALGNWIVIAPGVTPTADLVDLIGVINLGIRIGVAVTLVFTLVECALEVRRYRQLRSA